MSAPQKLVIGLGNPGAEYEGTRHNIGWQVVEKMALTGFSDWAYDKKANAEICRTSDGATWLVKPLTYMNRSGESVGQLVRYYRLQPTDIIVISDDADMAFGKIRYRLEGSSGGQKGLENIFQHLGTETVPRLKIGIGRTTESLTDYVLSRFDPAEEEQLPVVTDQAIEELRGHL